jgi:hypothetical protein
MTTWPAIRRKARIAQVSAASEHAIQAAIIEYLRAVLPRTYRAVAVANSPRSAIAGAKEKARGMAKGFPDMILIGPDGVCAFMEVKRPGGRLSPEQAEWGEWIVNGGGEYAVVRSVDDVAACLKAWNVPVRDVG